MANLREEVPEEFRSDDERWYRYFTKKSIAVLAGGIGVTFLLYKMFSAFHCGLVGFFIGATIAIGALFITVFKWPVADTLSGGGLTLARIIYNTICNKRHGRTFVKINESSSEESENHV